MSDRPPSVPALYADVIVPRHMRRTFTYHVPAAVQSRLHIGSRVEVPFGSGRLQGIVTQLHPTPPAVPGRRSPELRPIEAVLDENGPDITPDLFELSREISAYYLAPWGQTLRLILPPVARRSSRKPGWRRVHTGSATRGDDKPVAIPSIAPLQPPPAPAPPSPWWARLSGAIERRRHDVLLAIGSASWRTTTILQACEQAVRRDRGVVIVVPEISRAMSLAGLAAGRWGDRVAVLHSALTERQRYDAWWSIRRGDSPIVLGTRSAIFAPLGDRRPLGLVCVDGEEDPSLKDEQEPHYHAREVARLRAKRHDVPLLLASSHPSLETMQAVEADAVTRQSTGEGAAPAVQLIDLRQVARDMALSAPLIEALDKSIQARTGAVLYLNRKGFAAALWCRDCGAVPRCERCSLALRFYRGRTGRGAEGSPPHSTLTCLYCGASAPAPDSCPACRSPHIQPVGFGTARVEEEVRRLFPRARIARLDADTTARAGDAARLWRNVTVGAFDVLIGTQMLFAGPPLPRVGLVGIPNADAGLHLPDFRAAERTYHALSNAVSLARPAHEGGAVLLQTHLPTHPVMTAVSEHQPSLFYANELAFREAAAYPPYASLINLKVSGTQATVVQRAAEHWAELLRARSQGAGSTILGPVPAAMSRLRGRYRWHLLVKAPDAEAARGTVEPTLLEVEAGARAVKFDVDVDPLELL